MSSLLLLLFEQTNERKCLFKNLQKIQILKSKSDIIVHQAKHQKCMYYRSKYVCVKAAV